MRFVIELLDDNRYKLNAGYKHPALFVYNNKLLVLNFQEMIMDIKDEQDEIVYLDSSHFEQFINSVYSYEEDEFIIIHAAYNIDKGMFNNFMKQVKSFEKSYVKLEDKAGTVGISYIKSLKCINRNKYRDLFQGKDIGNIDNNMTIQIKEWEDFAKIQTICKLYETTKYPLECNLVDLFRCTAKQFKDEIAICYKNKKITYKQLDKITDQIARNIIYKIKNKSNAIGILLDHDWTYIVAMLSILKAGKIYVPMSKLYPIERLRMISEIGDLDGIIVDRKNVFHERELQNIFYEYNELLDDISDKIEVELPDNTYNSIAYIMFTSGSTGTPKGVRITHRNIINNAYFLYNKVFSGKKIEPNHYGVLAEFVFDMSVQQIYPALLFGNTLHIYPGDTAKTPQNMMRFFEEVDTCDVTPIAIRLVVDYMAAQLKQNNVMHMKYIHLVVGGEKLSYNLCKNYFSFCEDGDVTNIYGPTECTVEVSTYYLNKHILEELNNEIPIGYAIDNCRIYVLDERHRMLPPNVVGEIYVSGECVGDGYLNSNSMSFCKDILTKHTMYKTGDLGYFDDDGLLYYVGRNDRQIKVNGYRVDLGDIEKNLETIRYIDEARVFYNKFNDDEKKLVAYVHSEKDIINLNELLGDLRGKLPAYMIPSYFIKVNEFITNINGKLDLRKLPDLSHALRIKEDKLLEFEADDIIAKDILEYLENEFSCNVIGKSDCDLQSLGCDSLVVFKLMTFVEDRYGISMNDKSEIFASNLSVIIDNVKKCIEKDEREAGDKLQEEYIYKKRYVSLPMQTYLYNQEFEILSDGSSNLNSMLYLYELVDDVDEELLEESINEVANSHDAFHMCFKCKGAKCKVTYNKESQYYVEHIRYEIENVMCMNNIVPQINYFDDILAYFYIVTSKNRKYLLMGIHHLIFDYMSAIFLIKDVENYYFKKQIRKTSFFKIIEEKNNVRKSDDYRNGLEFWRNYAKNVSKVDNLFAPVIMNYEREVILYNVGGEELDKCARISGFSKFILCLGIFFSSLFCITDQKNITIGTFLNGREHIFPTSTIGFLSKYIPFTFENKGNLTEYIFNELKYAWNMIKKYEESADIQEILNNLKESLNVMFDYQVMNNKGCGNRLYNKIYTFENVQVGFALTYKLYEYKDKLAAEICYSKNNSIEIVNKIKCEFEKNLKETLKKYLENL